MKPEETTPAFEALRAEVVRDLEPVAPLRLARAFFPTVAVLASALIAFAMLRFGTRAGDELGAFGLWGIAGLELAVAAGLLGLGRRGAYPGRSPSLAALGGVAAVAVALHLCGVWYSFGQSPVLVPEGRDGGLWALCFGWEAALSVPVVLLAWLFVRRGLVTFPGRAAPMAGLGAGLVADGLWHLVCPYSEPLHALTAHTGAITAVVAVSLLLAALWDRARQP